MSTEARKHALRVFYTKVAEPMGFKGVGIDAASPHGERR
jgi:hypothetical protein